MPDGLHLPGNSQAEEYNRTEAPDPHPSMSTSSAGSSIASDEGRWGERDQGDPVSRRGAYEDFEEMRRELTRLSSQRSRSIKEGGRLRSLTSRRASHPKDEEKAMDEDVEKEKDLEGGEEPVDFDLGEFLMGGHLERRTTAGEPAKKVGVIFKNLTVKGVQTGASFVRTLPDAVIGTFGPDLYKILCHFIPPLRFGRQPPVRDLVHDFTGVLREGEIMLVLGRPGAGCSTFLKSVTNDREGYAGVSGEVTYGGLSSKQQHKNFRGEVIYNPEDDQHFATLTVWQTLKFALMNKTKKHDKASIPIIINALLKMFGITHTQNTIVGNEFIRGVSGGERKRVSLSEAFTGKAAVLAWDNSTRGLDASTALDYAKSLRIMADVSKRTMFVTLYQAGESIYELVDKVMVIDAGRMLYQGPANEARQYFIDLGFHCPEQSTTADFLTSLCDPNARQFQPGREASTPKTPEELEAVFKKSDAYQHILNEVDAYEKELQETGQADTVRFQKTVAESKSKTVPKKSSYTISFPRQVAACVQREFWLLWGDKTSLYTKYFIIISNALIVSSLFYGQSLDTSGAFSRGGALFFSVLFLGWLQLVELAPAVTGRNIVHRHRDYAFYNPSAVCIARVVVDFPAVFCMVVPFVIIVYFMTGLDVDVSKFWIYALFVYTITICITALYRMFAALSPSIDDAVRFSGIALNIMILYVGYVIPKQSLINGSIWFGWLFYVNPISYAYESVLTNEFSGRVMDCAPSQLVPQGPGVTDPRYQGCALTGSQLGNPKVSGDSYLDMSFQFTRSHLWRNFGVVIAFAVLYILVTVFAAEFLSFGGGGDGGALIFKRSKRSKNIAAKNGQNNDEEKTEKADDNAALSRGDLPSSGDNEQMNRISSSDRIFTWSHVDFTVPYGNGTRKLLNDVNGFAKPGLMIALMGASGAGKTTLLNTLAQRQKSGIVGGDMLVDGRPLGPDFKRGAGFCEQMDLHDGTSTIREAFEFSALLRQDRKIPSQEKIAYCDRIINLLELEEIQDAIIGSLNVEQRKRVTIGVELAAKPQLLLFLDEPTSGLDSQAAFSIVRFLRKLCDAGQAIVCTIHQPSSMLIQQFDMVLALNPGGNTFYFGDVGKNGSAIVKYFADRGFVCPPSKNIAEFILETAAKATKRNGKQIDWNEEWRNSEQSRKILEEIEHIKEERSKVPVTDAVEQYEFAAPTTLQTWLLTKRIFLQYWRDPSYYYGKLFVSVIMGIFNGFTFWMLDNSIASMQNRMFSAFLIILIPPVIVNSVVPKFYLNRALWEAREYPSRVYGWFAFCTANVVCEIPAAIVTSVVYWLLWYYPVGFSTDSSSAGYVFLMTMLFYLFQASWGQWICAFAPSFTVIANTLPFFFVMVSLFNGVVRPYEDYPVFWKYWMYYLNPTTWWLRGVFSTVFPPIQIRCSPQEATHFNPPPGNTCLQYAGNYVNNIAGTGYLLNPDAMSDCQYCQYANGTEYMSMLNVHVGDKWRSFGIFLAFVIVNWFLVYFFIYTVRVRGWSFGLGYPFAAAGWLIGAIKKPFTKKKAQDS